MERDTFARRQILKLYKEQVLKGEINIKEIKFAVGSKTVNYIYRIIREFKKDQLACKLKH